ncbi:MAG: ATP-binding protein [Deltaproteobacteria bacterium]
MGNDSPETPHDLLPSLLLDTAPDAMVVVGPDACIRFVNAQTEHLFGYERAELLGQHLDLLIPERFHERHAGHLARFFANPGMRPMGSGLELFGRCKNGAELPIEVSLSPLRTSQGLTVSASLRDISERKRAAAEARLQDEHQAEELRQARTLAEAGSAAKSEFLSSMSHELRTPLNAILGFAQLLWRDRREPLSERHKQRVEHILKGGEHLLRLIDDILDLSRIEAGQVSISTEPVSVRDVLEEVDRTLQPLAARQQIDLRVETLPIGMPMVAADRTRFAQILINLGSNAIKYNRLNGEVVFSVSQQEASFVRISIKDTGIGIPLDKQSSLFQPFQRAGQEAGPIEGTGIGLVITRRLAALMNGDVGFQSVPGQGSEFWVRLPIHSSCRSSQAPPEVGELPADQLVREGLRRVLYVEDNPANVLFMRDLLSNFESIALSVALSAELGVEVAAVLRPDVIIMDINLPGMSGFDALRTLRARADLQHIPVIALTAAASERDRQQGMQAGFYRYLTKPVQVDELIGALETLIQ